MERSAFTLTSGFHCRCSKLDLSYKIMHLCNYASLSQLPRLQVKRQRIRWSLSMHSTTDFNTLFAFLIFCLNSFSKKIYSFLRIKQILQLHYWTTFDRLCIVFKIRLLWWAFRDDNFFKLLVAWISKSPLACKMRCCLSILLHGEITAALANKSLFFKGIPMHISDLLRSSWSVSYRLSQVLMGRSRPSHSRDVFMRFWKATHHSYDTCSSWDT